MRVPRTLMLAAVAATAASCTSAPTPLAPGDRPAADGGIFTIGSGGKNSGADSTTPDPGSTTSQGGISTIGSGGKETGVQTTGTDSDSTTSRGGIFTIGSDG